LLAAAEVSDAELCAFLTLVLYRGFDFPKPSGLNAVPSRCGRRAPTSAKRKAAIPGPCCTSPMECLFSRSEPVPESDRQGRKAGMRDSCNEIYGTTHGRTRFAGRCSTSGRRSCYQRGPPFEAVPPSLPFVSNFDLIAVLAPAGMKDAFLVEATIGVSAEVVPQPLKKVSWAA
jgi:hypothetical protein